MSICLKFMHVQQQQKEKKKRVKSKQKEKLSRDLIIGGLCIIV